MQKKHDNVTCVESVDDIVAQYNSHDLVLVPSRRETFSYVTLEALTCGAPLIATAIPRPLSLIRHRETGLLIPPGDTNALANAILSMHRLSSSGTLYLEMCSNCTSSILRSY